MKVDRPSISPVSKTDPKLFLHIDGANFLCRRIPQICHSSELLFIVFFWPSHQVNHLLSLRKTSEKCIKNTGIVLNHMVNFFALQQLLRVTWLEALCHIKALYNTMVGEIGEEINLKIMDNKIRLDIFTAPLLNTFLLGVLLDRAHG